MMRTTHWGVTGNGAPTWSYVLCAGDVPVQYGRLVVRRDNGDRRRRRGVAACQRPVWLLAVSPSLVLNSRDRRNVAPEQHDDN